MSAPFPPIEPPATDVEFPDPRLADDSDVVALGSDFRAGTLLEAYRHGIFPWPQARGRVPWCSMDPRAISRSIKSRTGRGACDALFA